MISKGILIGCAILAALVGCRSERTTTVPDDLVGIWKTTEARYADRFFELTKSTITLGTGEGKLDVHPIASVSKAREDGNILYTIFYVDREGEKKFSFSYAAERNGVIRFKNQKDLVWTKQRG